MDYTIIVEGVSKKFGLSLRDAVNYGFIDTGRRLIGKGKNEILRPGEFWALDDISFCLEPGDALGIMGLNGSGKTTLLRILNGTYSPDKGSATLKGRIGALIAAGAGFSPMLTGRENVYVSAALIGMTPSEIEMKFDEILEFAGLENFIDMPVRNYSSGMSVRLGFAVAVLGSPDILLIDEVLAVGDINFQKKCFERINALKEAGTTIILVSHSPGSIWNVCNKGLVLHKGKPSGIIPVEEACKLYDHYNFLSRKESELTNKYSKKLISHDYGGSQGGTGDIIIEKLEIISFSSGKKTETVRFREKFILRCHIIVYNQLDECIIRVQVDAEINKCIAIIDSYELLKEAYQLKPGHYCVDIIVDNPYLRPGVYSFCPSIVPRRGGIHYFYEYNMATLIIQHIDEMFLYADFRASVFLEASFQVKKEV